MIRRRVPQLVSALGPVSVAALLCLGLAACNRQADEPPPPPADTRPLPKQRVTGDGTDPFAGVTPMAERVAVLGLLNKRNGLVRDITLKPGESIRVGRVVIRLRACERTAQWESPPETGAFVQMIVLDHGQDEWRRIFSGWLFKDRPDRNVVQHAIYDVFIKSCTMSWPGEVEVRDEPPPSDRPAAARESSEAQAPAAEASEAAAPAAEAAAPAAEPAAPAPESDSER